MLSVIPFFRSFVVATCSSPGCASREPTRLQREQLPGGRGEQAPGPGAPVAAGHEDVLDPDAAPARQVHPRLDGDRDPGSESTLASVPEHRRLVHLEAHAVAQAVLEVLAVAGLADQIP